MSICLLGFSAKHNGGERSGAAGDGSFTSSSWSSCFRPSTGRLFSDGRRPPTLLAQHRGDVSEDLVVTFAEERRRKSLRRRSSGSHSYKNISIGFHMETQPRSRSFLGSTG